MALPTKESIFLPLLRVIADAGGRLPMSEAIKRVEAFFPELTEEDKLQLLSSGRNKKWPNRVQWARKDLILKGYLDREAPKGIWQITEQGKEYLESEWPKWKPRYPSPLLIITGEKDRQKLRQLVVPLLSGTFHRLSRELIVLSPEEVEELYEALSRRKEMLKHFLA